ATPALLERVAEMMASVGERDCCSTHIPPRESEPDPRLLVSQRCAQRFQFEMACYPRFPTTTVITSSARLSVSITSASVLRTASIAWEKAAMGREARMCGSPISGGKYAVV